MARRSIREMSVVLHSLAEAGCLTLGTSFERINDATSEIHSRSSWLPAGFTNGHASRVACADRISGSSNTTTVVSPRRMVRAPRIAVPKPKSVTIQTDPTTATVLCRRPDRPTIRALLVEHRRERAAVFDVVGGGYVPTPAPERGSTGRCRRSESTEPDFSERSPGVTGKNCTVRSPTSALW